jgi:hypothetical protein
MFLSAAAAAAAAGWLEGAELHQSLKLPWVEADHENGET